MSWASKSSVSGLSPTANDAVLAEGKRAFDGVRVLGVDEHVWRHPYADLVRESVLSSPRPPCTPPC
jgi:hypothetical protein